MTETEFIAQEGPKAFIRLWKRVILDPQAFFREMPSSGGFENPLIFLGVCALIYLFLKLTVSGWVEAINALFLICLTYVFGPGILMLGSQFLFRGEGDYEGTLRVCAYAGACLTLAWVPALGIFGYVYGFYLVFLGTGKVHQLDTTRSAIATLLAILGTAAILLFVLGEGRIRRPIL
ncbi:MAG: YIP1 family protein [Deltaproteobacteria bacterium]|nr:YIP1 family protein [Deltaproteobacteria bacterium]